MFPNLLRRHSNLRKILIKINAAISIVVQKMKYALLLDVFLKNIRVVEHSRLRVSSRIGKTTFDGMPI